MGHRAIVGAGWVLVVAGSELSQHVAKARGSQFRGGLWFELLSH